MTEQPRVRRTAGIFAKLGEGAPWFGSFSDDHSSSDTSELRSGLQGSLKGLLTSGTLAAALLVVSAVYCFGVGRDRYQATSEFVIKQPLPPASALIEARIHGSVLVLVFLSVSFWNWQIKLDNPALVLVDFLLTIALGLGVGISALVIGHRIPIVKTLTKFGINRLVLWTSGIFYATYTLPGPIRPFVTWNPLLHSVELLRHGINLAYPIPGISLQYLFVCSSLSCGFGLLFYFCNEALLLSDD